MILPALMSLSAVQLESPGGYLCHVNLADPDEIWKKAMASGATQIAELKTQFWGDYYGSFKDPYGFEWAVVKA